MTDTEEKIADLQRESAIQDERLTAFIRSNEEFKNEMRRSNEEFKNEMRRSQENFIAEMRDRDNQRAAEMRDRDNQRAAEIGELKGEIRNIGSHVRNMAVAVIIGVAAMVISFVNYAAPQNVAAPVSSPQPAAQTQTVAQK